MFNKLPTFILIAIFVLLASNVIDSSFVYEFLDSNLITLLVALAAINTTTLGVVMTKLREVSQAYHVDFAKNIRDMRMSVKEQILLIIGSVIIQIISASSFVPQTTPYTDIAQVVLITVFIYALHLLYETANMIFVILEFENDEMKGAGRKT